MAKKRFVLPSDHYFTRPPVLATLVYYMALDYYSAPGWLWGVAGTFGALVWIVYFVLFWQQEPKPLAGYGEQKDKA